MLKTPLIPALRVGRPASRSMIQSLEPRLLYAIYGVTNTNDSGAGSLRDAISYTNTHLDTPAISFKIDSGVQTIQPRTPLPVIKTKITIDATTQPGYAGKPIIELNGESAGKGNGLQIAAGGCTLRGLVINRFNGEGILVVTNGGNTIKGNYIGTDVTGTIARPNSDYGILLGGSKNDVGGGLATSRNVISGNTNSGIKLLGSGAGNNLIQGNYIGVNATATAALGNGNNGLEIQGETNNTIGGASSGIGNVISGNKQNGIFLSGGASYTTVQGNKLGTDSTGKLPLGNGQSGIEIQSSNNLIGGTTTAARNIVSANIGSGIICWGYVSTCTNNQIIGNYVGTDITGTKALGNWGGVVFSDNAKNNILGGTSSASRNLISANTHIGLGFYNSSTGNTIQGNYIGTDVSGTKAIANSTGVGIYSSSTNNLIGGTSAAAGNIIAGNTNDGIDVFAGYTTIQFNILGKNGSSSTPPANGGTDILQNVRTGNVILNNV